MSKIIEQLKFEEGIRFKRYLCTAGFWTIGYGHNLDKHPYWPDGSKIPNEINDRDAEALLWIDVGNTIGSLRQRWPRFDEFDSARRDACINMAFQLGVSGFMRFERMRAAMLARDWDSAYWEALKSNWAIQTPERAKRVSVQIQTGKHYNV